jgi:hypothetical protein
MDTRFPDAVQAPFAGCSANRREFLERAGKMMVPYIIDPNTGTLMWQTGDIQHYLRTTYGK